MNPTPLSAALAEEIHQLVFRMAGLMLDRSQTLQFAQHFDSRVGPLVEALKEAKAFAGAVSPGTTWHDHRMLLLRKIDAALATEPSGAKEVGQQIVTGMIAAVTDGLRSGEISTKGGDESCATSSPKALSESTAQATNTTETLATVVGKGAGNVPPEPRVACCVCGGPESKERPGWCADAFCGAVTKPVVNRSDEATDSGATPEVDQAARDFGEMVNGISVVRTRFARALERQRNAAIAERDDALGHLEETRSALAANRRGIVELYRERDALRAELEALKAQGK